MGLDQHEVQRWDGQCRHITLVMLAQAYLAVIRDQVLERGEKGVAVVRRRTDSHHSSRGEAVAHPLGMDGKPTA